MTIRFQALNLAMALLVSVALVPAETAQAAPEKSTASKATKKSSKRSSKHSTKKAAPKPVVELPPPPAADATQIDAAKRVYYGVYACEFKDSVEITKSAKFPAYVDVRHDKSTYLMKPVLSATGAIRLEDVHGVTLMVQISSKSMLLNVQTGHRIVDDCVSPEQHELIEEARIAKTKASEAAAASAASAVAVSAESPTAGASAAAP